MLDFQSLLGLSDVKVLDSRVDEHGDLIIQIESTSRGTQCRRCQRTVAVVHGTSDPVFIRHLDIFERRCYLEYRAKRYRCPHCSSKGKDVTTSQRVSWHRPRSSSTIAFEQRLMFILVNGTVTDVAIKLRVSENIIFGLIDFYVSKEVCWDDFREIPILGLDEIALKKGHRDFVTIISTRIQGAVRIIAVLPDRKKDTIVAFLKKIPARLRRTIKEACVDLYEGFSAAIREVLPEVSITADRFHVAKLYREATDELRKAELRRLRKELSTDEYDEIKGSMWPFRQNNLEPEENPALDKLLTLSPALRRARELRDELTDIFDRIDNKHGAKIAIGKWMERVRNSGLTCYDKFMGTLEKWWDQITNYFVGFNSSGFVEGLNNRIKVLKRRCFGLGSAATLYQRLKLDLEGFARFAASAA